MERSASENGRLDITDPSGLDFCWADVRPWLDRSCEYSPEYTVDQLRLGVLSGQYLLYVAHEDGGIIGAAVVQIIQYPQFRAAHIAALGGRGLVGHPTLIHRFRASLKAQGCSKIQYVARPSAARLYRLAGFSSTGLEFVRDNL